MCEQKASSFCTKLWFGIASEVSHFCPAVCSITAPKSDQESSLDFTILVPRAVTGEAHRKAFLVVSPSTWDILTKIKKYFRIVLTFLKYFPS